MDGGVESSAWRDARDGEHRRGGVGEGFWIRKMGRAENDSRSLTAEAVLDDTKINGGRGKPRPYECEKIGLSIPNLNLDLKASLVETVGDSECAFEFAGI